MCGFGYTVRSEEGYQKSRDKQIKQISYDELKQIRDKPFNEVTFVEGYTSCCVGIVDIVNSTRITSKLVNDKVCKYYSIFLNTMAYIARDFGAKLVKNIGDSLLYYFPETSYTDDKTAFRNVLECSMTMINHHTALNQKMYNEGLPDVNYRTSLDYGTVLIACSFNSSNEDIFGSTVNLCAKINSIAKPNGIVIGGDLHQNVKNFEEYDFNLITTYSSGLKLEYPVYSIIQRKTKK